MALVMAAMGLTMAYRGPSNAYDTETLSTPVSGVDTKKDIVEDLEAPLRRKPSAAGITPHEQSGKGAPIIAALLIEPNDALPMCFSRKETGTSSCITPATSKPNSSHGADSMNNARKFCPSKMISDT